MLGVINANNFLILALIQGIYLCNFFNQVNMLVLCGLFAVVRVHQMHLIPLVYVVLLVDTNPFVILGLVV